MAISNHCLREVIFQMNLYLISLYLYSFIYVYDCEGRHLKGETKKIPNQSNMLSDCIRSYKEDPEKLTIHVWYLITLFVIITCMTFIGAAAENNVTTEETTDGFICIWSMFIFAAVTAYGYFAMMKWEEEFSLGCFMGLCTMVVQYTLVLFAHFVSASKEMETDGDGVVAAFCFMLCLLYIFFTYLLVTNRKYFIAAIKTESKAGGDNGSEGSSSKDKDVTVVAQQVNYEAGHVTTALPTAPVSQEQHDIVEKDNAFNHAQV